MAIPDAKPRAALPQHVPMPSPVEGVAERRRQGVSHPLIKPPHHRLHMVGCGLDMDHSLVGALPGWVKLMGISLVPLHELASESAF
jgi:hypothetical protein